MGASEEHAMTSMISECNMIKEVDETNKIGKRMSPAYFRPDNTVHLKMRASGLRVGMTARVRSE
jgi:hypothetical protein